MKHSSFNTSKISVQPETIETSLYRYLRMSPNRFEHLLIMVAPLLTKTYCPSRVPISASERLIVTLR